MTIIVEDGTGVEGANSYVSVDDLKAYAEDRNITISPVYDDLEAMLHCAMDYLNVVARTYSGIPTFTQQPLPFPRTVLRNHRWIDIGVPAEIKQAQMVAAIAARDDTLLGRTKVESPGQATEKTVGPITVRYAAGGSTNYPISYIPEVMALLARWGAGGIGQPSVVKG